MHGWRSDRIGPIDRTGPLFSVTCLPSSCLSFRFGNWNFVGKVKTVCRDGRCDREGMYKGEKMQASFCVSSLAVIVIVIVIVVVA